MAWNLSRLCRQLPRILCIDTLTRCQILFYSKFEIDVLDDFTSQLIERKISKWDLVKRKNQAIMENSHKPKAKQSEDVTIGGLDNDRLGFLFQRALDNEDNESVINLIKLCVRHNKAPPFTILLNVLAICSRNGEKESICDVQRLYKISQPEILAEDSNFQHFVAEATWVRGDVAKAVEIFEEVYRSNAYLRRRIRLMLKYLIPDLVPNRSEAALRRVISFSEQVLTDFQDFFPLTCVWQACFLSEWFTDQCMALELLEKHTALCKSVVNRIPYVVFVSLKCHRTEVVYRLLELLLKYRMKSQISNVLTNLLGYQLRAGDLQSCLEIIKWAAENKVHLKISDYRIVMSLLVSEGTKTSLVSLEPKVFKKNQYNFKF